MVISKQTFGNVDQFKVSLKTHESREVFEKENGGKFLIEVMLLDG